MDRCGGRHAHREPSDVPLVIRTQIVKSVLEDMRRPRMEATMREDLPFNSPVPDFGQRRPVDIVGPEIWSVGCMSFFV